MYKTRKWSLAALQPYAISQMQQCSAYRIFEKIKRMGIEKGEILVFWKQSRTNRRVNQFRCSVSMRGPTSPRVPDLAKSSSTEPRTIMRGLF